MGNKNYYELLEISSDASFDDIKIAYRKLAIRYHPDKNQGDALAEELFKNINEAYSILSDEEKKKSYDSKLNIPKSSSFSNTKSEPKKVNPISLRTKGATIRVIASLTKSDLVNHTSKEILTVKYEECGYCHGSGRNNESEVDLCLNCLGSGIEELRTYTSSGSFTSTVACHECHGLRTTNSDECGHCNGFGYNKIQSSVMIELNRSMKTGDLITMSGLGEPSPNGGEFGDLIIKLFIR